MSADYRIRARFSEWVLCPHDAIDRRFFTDRGDLLVTDDGVVARPKFTASFDNSDGSYDDVLDFYSMDKFGMRFSSIKSLWIARLGQITSCWHLIKMEKNGV